MDSVPVRVNPPASEGRHATDQSGASARVNGSGHTGTGGRPGPHHGKQKRSKLRLILLATGAVLILGALVLSGLFVYRASTAATIDSSRYQAVFFTNGQVYFGKLKTVNGAYMKLTDIFYLQAQTKTADAADSKNPQETTSQQTSDVQLVKLGNEVHGPDDEMIISKDQILFFENLKKDGKVTDSITKYQSQKK